MDAEQRAGGKDKVENLFPKKVRENFSELTQLIFNESFCTHKFDDRWYDFADSLSILRSPKDFDTYNRMLTKVLQWKEEAKVLRKVGFDENHDIEGISLGHVRRVQSLLHSTGHPSFMGILLLIKEYIDPHMTPAVENELLSGSTRFTYIRAMAALRAVLLRVAYRGFGKGHLGAKRGAIISMIESVYLNACHPGKVLCLYQRVLKEVMDALLDAETNCLFEIEFVAAAHRVDESEFNEKGCDYAKCLEKINVPPSFALWKKNQKPGRENASGKEYKCDPDVIIFKGSVRKPFQPEVITIDRVTSTEDSVKKTRELCTKRIRNFEEVKNETMEISSDDEPERKRPKLLRCEEILDDLFDDELIEACEAAEKNHQTASEKPHKAGWTSHWKLESLQTEWKLCRNNIIEVIFAESPLFAHAEACKIRKLLARFIYRCHAVGAEGVVFLDEYGQVVKEPLSNYRVISEFKTCHPSRETENLILMSRLIIEGKSI